MLHGSYNATFLGFKNVNLFSHRSLYEISFSGLFVACTFPLLQ